MTKMENYFEKVKEEKKIKFEDLKENIELFDLLHLIKSVSRHWCKRKQLGCELDITEFTSGFDTWIIFTDSTGADKFFKQDKEKILDFILMHTSIKEVEKRIRQKLYKENWDLKKLLNNL